MDLTQELMDDIRLKAKEVEYGKVIVAITGPQGKKIVDIIAENRDRFRETRTASGEIRYERDEKNA